MSDTDKPSVWMPGTVTKHNPVPLRGIIMNQGTTPPSPSNKFKPPEASVSKSGAASKKSSIRLENVEMVNDLKFASPSKARSKQVGSGSSSLASKRRSKESLSLRFSGKKNTQSSRVPQTSPLITPNTGERRPSCPDEFHGQHY